VIELADLGDVRDALTAWSIRSIRGCSQLRAAGSGGSSTG
jgi:hypothetical protein